VTPINRYSPSASTSELSGRSGIGGGGLGRHGPGRRRKGRENAERRPFPFDRVAQVADHGDAHVLARLDADDGVRGLAEMDACCNRRHFRFLKMKSLILPPLDRQTAFARILAQTKGSVKMAEQATALAETLSHSLLDRLFGDQGKSGCRANENHV